VTREKWSVEIRAADDPSTFDAIQLAHRALCWKFKTVSESVVKVDPEIMSGEPCFAGTRVPIQTLIDHLEAGDSIEDFLDGFPTVSRDQVIAFLKEAKERMSAAAVK
jgi:uncharacterized protein (DUF433 family)